MTEQATVRRCRHCDAVLPPTLHANARYCNFSHKMAKQNSKYPPKASRRCLQCNEPIPTTLRRDARYCSHEHAVMYNHQRNRKQKEVI